MLKIIKQNQNIIFVSLGLFLVSMTTLMFLINGASEGSHGELKTEVVSPEGDGPVKAEAYREVIGNEEDAFIVLRADGTIKYASPEFLEATGFKKSEIADKIFYSLINPNDLPVFLSSFGKALTSKGSSALIGPYRIRDAKDEYSINLGMLYQLKNESRGADIVLTYKNVSETTKMIKDGEVKQSAQNEAETNTEESLASGRMEDALQVEAASNEQYKPSYRAEDYSDPGLLKADIFQSDNTVDNGEQETFIKSKSKTLPPDTLTAPRNKKIKDIVTEKTPDKVDKSAEKNEKAQINQSQKMEILENKLQNLLREADEIKTVLEDYPGKESHGGRPESSSTNLNPEKTHIKNPTDASVKKNETGNKGSLFRKITFIPD